MFKLLLLALVAVNSQQNYLNMIRRQPHLKWRNKIVCQVCKQSVKEINSHARILRKHLEKEHLPITEENYLNLTQYICEPYHPDGEWISKYDLVKQPPKLLLKLMNEFGRCNRECETIAHTCKYIFGGYGLGLYEKTAEVLFRQYSIAKIQIKVCSNVCKMETSDVRHSTDIGSEKFKPIDDSQKKRFQSFVISEQLKYENQDPNMDQAYLEQWVEEHTKQEAYDKELEKNKIQRRKRLCAKGLKTGDDCIFDDENDGKEEKDETIKFKEIKRNKPEEHSTKEDL